MGAERREGMSRLDSEIADETAFVLEPKEQKKRDLLEQLTLMDNIKKRKEREIGHKRQERYVKKRRLADERGRERLKAFKKKNARIADFKAQKSSGKGGGKGGAKRKRTG